MKDEVLNMSLLGHIIALKFADSGLIQFLATESPLKMMKNAFYLTLKLFLFPRYLNLCFDILVMYEKQFDLKHKVNFKIYDVTNWLTNKRDTLVA